MGFFSALLGVGGEGYLASPAVVAASALLAGQVFDQSAVVELSPPSVRGQVPARLQALVRRELLRPARSRLAGDQGFQFRHLLLRDATYDSIPKQARAELHELFAGAHPFGKSNARNAAAPPLAARGQCLRCSGSGRGV